MMIGNATEIATHNILKHLSLKMSYVLVYNQIKGCLYEFSIFLEALVHQVTEIYTRYFLCGYGGINYRNFPLGMKNIYNPFVMWAREISVEDLSP